MSMSQAEIEALMNGPDLTSEEDVELDMPNIEDIEANDSEEDFDESILDGIDGITDNEEIQEKEDGNSKEKDESIDKSKYPLPVENEHKVVNQLNEVAEDNEQKASQIFDVLSFILDENSSIQQDNQDINEFLEKQVELLESLSEKFPNVSVFNENLGLVKKAIESSSSLSSKLNSENSKIFEAMELMQYHDINRQKIERVMSVIRKLNIYLNGIFEDDTGKENIQIAKQISGDSSDSMGDDDLEALISEFAK